MLTEWMREKLNYGSVGRAAFALYAIRYCLYLNKGEAYYRIRMFSFCDHMPLELERARIYCDCNSNPIIFNSEDEAYDFMRIPIKL